MNKKVIIGAFFHWGSYIHIGSHQYAKQFASQGYKVAYISKAISPLHFLFAKEKNTFKERLDEWYKGGKWYEESKIWAYTPLSLIPVHRKPFLTKRFIVKNANNITLPSIRNILKKNGFNHVDVLFLDEADKYLLNLNLHDLSIYRIHDDITNFKRYPALFEVQKEVIKSVDIVISSSQSMRSLAKKIGAKRTVYLPNGVEFEHFYLGDDTLPEEYKNIPSPRVIYVGSIAKWFDIDILFFAAKNLPNFSFILIGQPKTDLSKLYPLKNVYILGPKRYNILPQYIKNSDVGIIPWDCNNSWVRASHPNKLYMYMACGLPVVSTKWKELENIKSPAYITSNKKEFAGAVECAILDKKIKKYIEFARRNSWKNRLNILLEEIYRLKN